MNKQIYVHTMKEQNEDGSWNVTVTVNDERDLSGSNPVQIAVLTFQSEYDPQIEHLDFT